MAKMAFDCSTLTPEASGKTESGLQANVAGALSYLLGWVTGIIFLFLEKENRFVRFHAVQSIAVFGAITVAAIVFNMIPVIGWVLTLALGVGTLILWVVLMYRAYLGRACKLPVAGDIAEQQVKPKG